MLGRSLTLAAAALLAATPTAPAAPSSGCPMNSASGWMQVSASGWGDTPAGSVYKTAPQYDAAEWAAFFAARDADGDDVVCLQFGVLNDGRPPYVWPGYVPFSVIDDGMRS